MNETIFNMKKSTTLFIIALIMSNYYLFSQQYNFQPKQGIEIQLGANSPFISLKYQHYLWLNSRQHITLSGGVGMFQYPSFNHDITHSIGNGRHFWEIGVLGLYTPSKFNDRTDYDYYVLPMTGYKYISSKGAYFRIHFSPYFDKRGSIYPLGGVSIGYFLKEKRLNESHQNINTIRYRKD